MREPQSPFFQLFPPFFDSKILEIIIGPMGNKIFAPRPFGNKIQPEKRCQIRVLWKFLSVELCRTLLQLLFLQYVFALTAGTMAYTKSSAEDHLIEIQEPEEGI
jgi:hypothetical protein